MTVQPNDKIISMIVAMAANRVIGANNKIPWRLPRDQQMFKVITMGKPIVMGRKTYESIGRPLPGRHNIIVTRNSDFEAAGCTVIHSPEAAIEAAGEVAEVVIIGGSFLYEHFLPQANRLYLTTLDGRFEGDTLFPKLNANEWNIIQSEHFSPDEKNVHAYNYQLLERVATPKSHRLRRTEN